MQSRLGVVLDSFRQLPREALQSAAQLGFRKIEMPAVSGPVTPTELTGTGRRHLSKYVSSLGLELSALGSDLGSGRFTDSSKLEQSLEKTQAILEMARDLHVPVVTTHLGRIVEQDLEGGYLLEAVQQLADLSDRTGTFVALETAGAEPARFADMLRRINSPTLGVCYDPASLLIDGFEPLGGIEQVANTILLARARDALAGSPQHPGREAPLGSGQLDLPEYLAALDQAGYRNVPFIRRTESQHPLDEIADAKRKLDKLIRA
jgi:sugar phosphate isomerase/epimerase